MSDNIKFIIKSETLKAVTFSISKEGRALSFEEVFNGWKESLGFRQQYNTWLCESHYRAVYWEHPGLTHSNLDAPYECTIIEGTELDSVPPDPSPFQTFFADGKEIACFLNLGKDALLISPAQFSEPNNYLHLLNFARSAPKHQIDNFWQKVAAQTLNAVKNRKIWLNTAGMGVFWLHVRLDSYPKYYKFSQYL